MGLYKSSVIKQFQSSTSVWIGDTLLQGFFRFVLLSDTYFFLGGKTKYQIHDSGFSELLDFKQM